MRFISVILASLLCAACGSSAVTDSASPPTEPTTTPAPTVEAPATPPPSPTAEQSGPTITNWQLEVDEVPCEPSDLPGSPGGEAVLPAAWATLGADHVAFTVDGDLRPANLVRDPSGPGNIQVPCDPTLNDGHQVSITAFAGEPGAPGPGSVGETFIVVTTATAPTDEGQPNG